MAESQSPELQAAKNVTAKSWKEEMKNTGPQKKNWKRFLNGHTARSGSLEKNGRQDQV